jgi:hypothetical protein
MWQAMLHDKKSVLDANKGQDRFSLRLLWDELCGFTRDSSHSSIRCESDR